MKKSFAVFLIIAVIAGCNSNESKENTPDVKNETPAARPDDAVVEKGLNLIAKSDCLTCHKIADVSTGPSYTAVAAKYPDNEQVVDSLSVKIIKGGSGNWGTVPMTPHPSLSPEDAKAMVKYVLSLKK